MAAKARKSFQYLIVCSTFVIFIYTVLNTSTNRYSRTIEYASYDDRPERSTDKSKYEEILQMTNCEYKPIEFRIQQRSQFWVLYNFVKAKKHFKCHESITLTANADYRFLENLIPLVKRWKGPISLAIYAPGDDFYKTVDSIAYLRNCETVLVKEFVTFHVYFDFLHTPQKIDEDLRPYNHKLKLYMPYYAVDFLSMNASSLQKAYKDTYSCSKKAPYLNVDSNKTYKSTHKLVYPINVARNIAREAAQTYYVFPSDIELYPTYNFIDKFLSMLVKNPELMSNDQPKVFVLPIFEIVSEAEVPGSKKELQKMFKNNTAFLFHAKLCAICHKVPKDKEWMEANETEELNVFTVGKRLKYHRFWEAFYVGTHADPLFDERLTWEGQSNKMAQGFSLCLLDYNYMVLDNAFLIHRPGIKKQKEQIKKYGKYISATNFLVRHHIKPELEALYGKRDGCVLG